MTAAERKRAWRQRLYWDLRLFGLPAWVRDLWTLGLTIMLVLALTGQQGQNDRTTALAADIQRERASATFNGCHDQNVRHDRTIAKLHSIVAKLPPGRERRRAKRNIGGTVALIDALAPRQDCAALVKRRVQAVPFH